MTKHAAVGLAEWIALTYGDDGIKVSVLCPQAVRTNMTKGKEDHVASVDGMMDPEPVAQACLEAIEQENLPSAAAQGSAAIHAQQNRKLRSLDRRHAQTQPQVPVEAAARLHRYLRSKEPDGRG